MPAPMIVPIVLMGAAALGVAAMDSSRKRGRTSGGTRRTYTLDAGLPAPIRGQVLGALANEDSPDKLEALASAIAGSYPLSAAALRSKAIARRTTNPIAPSSSSASSDVANVVDPLATIPEPAHSQIAEQLAHQTDAGALETYATQLAPIYPAASTLLRVRAMQLRTTAAAAAAAAAVTPPALPTPPPIVAPTPPPIVTAPVVTPPAIATTSLPTPPPIAAPPPSSASTSAGLPTTPVSPPIVTPPPMVAPPIAMPPIVAPMPTAPVVTPPPILAGLDPGMPLEVQKAVAGALTAETDPAKLEGFASAIQAQYPIAAGLLVGKAQMLRARSATPALPPALPPAPTSTPATTSPTVPLTMSPYKFGDDRTRVGRNGGRPSGFPFIVLRPSDATYPAKIAKQATGFEGNWGEMTSLNPHFAPDGKWMNLAAGDALNVPWEWAPTLARIYDVRTDPGVTPSTSPVPNAAPLLRTTSTTSAAPTPPALPPAPTPASTASSSSAPAPSTMFTPVSTIAPSTAAAAPAPAPPQVPDPLLTYVVQAGDSPARIAGNLVHDQSRWRELVAANPKKPKAADGNFKSLMPGERLTLPDSWVSTHATSPATAGGSSVAFA